MDIMICTYLFSLRNTGAWHLVSNNVIVRPHSQQMFTIYDLQPSTGYTVRITAHNSAGSSVNTYSCTTLPAGEGQSCQQTLPKCPKKAPTRAFSLVESAYWGFHN